jgi:hypothetical protein
VNNTSLHKSGAVELTSPKGGTTAPVHFSSIPIHEPATANNNNDDYESDHFSKSPRSSNPFDTYSTVNRGSTFSTMSNDSMQSITIRTLPQQVENEQQIRSPSNGNNSELAIAAGDHFRYGSESTQQIVEAHQLNEQSKLIGAAAAGLGPFGLILTAISSIMKFAAGAKRNASNCRFFAARCHSLEPVIQRLQTNYTDEMVTKK